MYDFLAGTHHDSVLFFADFVHVLLGDECVVGRNDGGTLRLHTLDMLSCDAYVNLSDFIASLFGSLSDSFANRVCGLHDVDDDAVFYAHGLGLAKSNDLSFTGFAAGTTNEASDFGSSDV